MMSNENTTTNPTDDTEGHASKFRPAPAVDPADDTEGHAVGSRH